MSAPYVPDRAAAQDYSIVDKATGKGERFSICGRNRLLACATRLAPGLFELRLTCLDPVRSKQVRVREQFCADELVEATAVFLAELGELPSDAVTVST